MAVDLEYNAKGVLDIDHAERFLVRKILADGHTLLANGGDDLCQKVFKGGVLHRKVERAKAAVRDFASAASCLFC